MSNNFQSVGSLRPGRSVFNLSYEKKFTCDMGQLIPIMCDEMVPGDVFKIGNQALVRFQPLVSPVMHEISMYVHYFFVPYRLLWPLRTYDEVEEEWVTEQGSFEEFITGGPDGDNDDALPTWTPTDTSVGSLWDYLGFPTGVDPDGAYPLDFPRRAYAMIYNEFYRDQTLQDPLPYTNEDIANRNWEKDYFTISLPWQQRGTAPALPVSGTTFADFTNAMGDYANADTVEYNTSAQVFSTGVVHSSDLLAAFNKNEVDLSSASTFDIADLRLAFQIQKWMERNARAGARYTEFLNAHFGVSPRDERLQRPEYIGGTKAPIIISEVLQTSETDTSPQGNLAGHGITVSDGYAGSVKAYEFGLVMGIMSIMPRSAYQQGINRQWLRQTKYDFPFPEFANLSEQQITNAELIAIDGDDTHNTGVFGYQGRFEELRYKPNMICGQLRAGETYNYWHLGREFNPASAPSLNSDFITCEPSKRIFAAETEPGMIVSFGNSIKAIRPIPAQAEPGLIDHN